MQLIDEINAEFFILVCIQSLEVRVHAQEIHAIPKLQLKSSSFPNFFQNITSLKISESVTTSKCEASKLLKMQQSHLHHHLRLARYC